MSKIVRAISEDGSVVASAIDAKDIVSEIEKIHKTSAVITAALGRLTIAGSIIGNSLKSDVLPVLNIGGHAIHIPYHTTWEYEKIDFEIKHENFKSFASIKEILTIV